MEEEGKEEKKKEISWVRENIEAVIVAIVLALIIRQFAMEAFVIPTGSMAPTLYGEHIELACPNCAREFAIGKKRVAGNFESAYACSARCPRCKVTGTVYLHDGDAFYDEAEAVCRACGHEWWVKRPDTVRVANASRTSLKCPNCEYEFRRDILPSELTGGHKILVNKAGLMVRDPQRWDVIVFKFPEKDPGVERKNYIKRLVGLPNEDIRIWDGDIQINGRVARKDLDVIRAMCYEVFNSQLEQKWEKFIPWEPSDDKWNLSAGSLEVAGHEGASSVKFTKAITAAMPYSGSSSSARVTDFGLQLTVNCQGEGEFFCTLYDCEYRFRLILPVGGEQPARLMMNDSEVADAGVRLAPGENCSVELLNIDDRVLALVGGKEIFSYEYVSEVKVDRDPEIVIGTVDTAARFTRLRVYRDLHYSAKDSATYHTGPDEYFALGDNSPSSSDSRIWGNVPARNMLGCAFVIFWPIPQARFVK